MGPCKPGQVGNEAAISSLFQVRWAPHRGPATKITVGSLAAMDCPCPKTILILNPRTPMSS